MTASEFESNPPDNPAADPPSPARDPQGYSDGAQSGPATRTNRFRFSIRTLLIVAMVSAAFLAGRMGDRWPWRAESIAGTYEIQFPAGAVREISILKLGDGNYRLQGGGVLNGIYQVKGDKLLVVQPDDPRMLGLAWRKQTATWKLFREPVGTPTGSSYVGATLTPKRGSATRPTPQSPATQTKSSE